MLMHRFSPTGAACAQPACHSMPAVLRTVHAPACRCDVSALCAPAAPCPITPPTTPIAPLPTRTTRTGPNVPKRRPNHAECFGTLLRTCAFDRQPSRSLRSQTNPSDGPWLWQPPSAVPAMPHDGQAFPGPDGPVQPAQSFFALSRGRRAWVPPF